MRHGQGLQGQHHRPAGGQALQVQGEGRQQGGRERRARDREADHR